MKQLPRVGKICMIGAPLAFAFVAAVHPAGATVLFSDNFNLSNGNLTTEDNSTSASQGGTFAGTTYVGQTTDTATISNDELLIPVATHVSPDINFLADSPSLDISFDALSTGDYGSFKIGSGTGNYANAGTDGFGFLFLPNGTGTVYFPATGGETSDSSFTYTPVTSGLNTFNILFNQTTASSDSVTLTINGELVNTSIVGIGGTGTSAAQGYISLADYNSSGSSVIFDNLSITSPAPEPSQIGMIALIGIGLGGLMLKARKRRGATFA